MSGSFPNVPVAPGVPPLQRAPDAVASPPIVPATSDAPTAAAAFAPPRWGLFLNGQPVLTADSVVDLDFRQESRVSTAPQEEGAYMSYNKVADPLGARITFAKGGTIPARAAFLAQASAALASIGLYSLVLPEITYANVDIIHQGFRRSDKQGATLLLLDIWVEEIRVTGTAAFSATGAAPITNPIDPTAADPANGGTVQPQPPTPAQAPYMPGSGDPAQAEYAAANAGQTAPVSDDGELNPAFPLLGLQ